MVTSQCCKCFVDTPELPLLAAEVRVANDAVAVDGVESGSLSEGEQVRFDLVGAEDPEGRIGKQREWDAVGRGESLRLVDA